MQMLLYLWFNDAILYTLPSERKERDRRILSPITFQAARDRRREKTELQMILRWSEYASSRKKRTFIPGFMWRPIRTRRYYQILYHSATGCPYAIKNDTNCCCSPPAASSASLRNGIISLIARSHRREEFWICRDLLDANDTDNEINFPKMITN